MTMNKRNGLMRRYLILFVVFIVVIAFRFEPASAGTGEIKQTGSKTWSVPNDGPELLKVKTKTTYKNGKVARDSHRYYEYMIHNDESASLYNTYTTREVYKYKKGRLYTVACKDRYDKVTKDVYIYKNGRLSKRNCYTRSKRTGKYVKKAVICYSYGKLKMVETRKTPKGKLTGKKTVTKYDSKGRIKSVTDYLDYGEYVDHYTYYTYYKSGSLKTLEYGDEYEKTEEFYDKNGLLLRSIYTNYDEGEVPVEYTYAYSDYYNGDMRYPQYVEVYREDRLIGKETRTYNVA